MNVCVDRYNAVLRRVRDGDSCARAIYLERVSGRDFYLSKRIVELYIVHRQGFEQVSNCRFYPPLPIGTSPRLKLFFSSQVYYDWLEADGKRGPALDARCGYYIHPVRMANAMRDGLIIPPEKTL